ncbi:SAM-dependent methyltransferase 2 [Liberibacter crescens BT-1]|uniref:SAM-dependent methyltransferase 2 n=1 Tax=Liberibacter crescens (strain BT-1) TaxID=1215343 RepID=L0EWU3_LIBCB|nr:methyltransferase domain-containing protein [Liberibacter crescens]AGA65118.1 SAM-dependent methyltransferase 2 [Liberibacter crescens BT-1]AMC13091.1 SAM-dependent methyltransferase [Liberibacter crescens]
MYVDVLELYNFYNSRLGIFAKDSIIRVLLDIWPDVSDKSILGLGYPLPFLESFHGRAERILAFMPAGQGAISWPNQALSATALVSEEELPLPDASIDRVLVIHSLEFLKDPSLILNEIWRILASDGRMIVIVPNLCGMWSNMESSPFGCGKSYFLHQIISFLEDINFTLSFTSGAMFFPPTNKVFFYKFPYLFEKVGRILCPGFAGVYIVEVRKVIYQGLPVHKFQERRKFVPVLIPQSVLT